MLFKKSMPTQQRLQELFIYENGKLINKKRRGKTNAGDEAGFISVYDYRVIRVDLTKYYAHRLIWVYHYGNIVDSEIDHIDGNRQNNEISNLRIVTRQVNNQNLHLPRKNNTTGYLGVTKKFGKFCAQIVIDGKVSHIGMFHTAKQASEAYLDAKRLHHVGCTI